MPPHAYARGHGSDQDGPVPVRPAPVPVDGKNPRAPGHHHLRYQYRHRASFRIHRLACRSAARSGSLVPQSVDGGRGNDFRRIVPHPAGAARADGPRPAPAHTRLRAYRDDAGGDVPPAQYPGEDVHPRPQAHGVGAGCPLRAQRRRRGRVHQRGQARSVLRSPYCRQGRQAPARRPCGRGGNPGRQRHLRLLRQSRSDRVLVQRRLVLHRRHGLHGRRGRPVHRWPFQGNHHRARAELLPRRHRAHRPVRHGKGVPARGGVRRVRSEGRPRDHPDVLHPGEKGRRCGTGAAPAPHERTGFHTRRVLRRPLHRRAAGRHPAHVQRKGHAQGAVRGLPQRRFRRQDHRA